MLVGGMLAASCAVALANDGYRIDTVAEGLEHPWSLAFLPDGRMLVTERAGRMRVICRDGALSPPLAGVPEAFVRSQAGLFDVVLAPDYDDTGWLYLSLADGTARANTTRLVRGRLDGERLVDVETLFTAMPRRGTPAHYGGRMAWLPDGTLVLALGDAFELREHAQKLDDHLGTIVRLNADGSVPADNPFVDRPDALPEIYSYGHRNAQAILYDADHDLLLAHEHGPRGGDELNHIRPGRNYGWPVITYGVDYSGSRISPYTEKEGMEQPLIDWTPSIAPAGMALYDGDAFPEWRGDLFVATLVEPGIRRVLRDGPDIVGEEVLLQDAGQRIRDVRVGPDGLLYLLTDYADGAVLRVRPAD